MLRVQIPAYTDRWMMGDRYGDLIKVTRRARNIRRILDEANIDEVSRRIDIAHVKLDISGKTMRFILDDCTMVS